MDCQFTLIDMIQMRHLASPGVEKRQVAAMAKGHSFLLLYDYGNHHLFRIKVVGLNPTLVSGAKYPRVVAKKGKAIKQYGY